MSSGRIRNKKRKKENPSSDDSTVTEHGPSTQISAKEQSIFVHIKNALLSPLQHIVEQLKQTDIRSVRQSDSATR